MQSIHLKLYNFSELEEQIMQRKEFKTDFTEYFIAKNEDYKRIIDVNPEHRENLVPEDEIKIVEGIIEKFVFETDGKHQDQVDLSLTLKALPARVDENNCYRIELFNYAAMQKAIIAFQNTEQDMLFKFYDNRNKNRLRKLN